MRARVRFLVRSSRSMWSTIELVSSESDPVSRLWRWRMMISSSNLFFKKKCKIPETQICQKWEYLTTFIFGIILSLFYKNHISASWLLSFLVSFCLYSYKSNILCLVSGDGEWWSPAQICFSKKCKIPETQICQKWEYLDYLHFLVSMCLYSIRATCRYLTTFIFWYRCVSIL